jgi:zinc transporter ZupT
MLYLLPFLSVILGYLIAIFLQPKNKTNLKLLLAFSGAFLLSITVIHLLPEIYESQNKYIGIFIMVGILFQIVLEFFSKGAEHGHVHGHDKLTQIPWALFLSLCLHALLEGFPVGHHHDLAIGIAIHHFPIAIILTSFFLSAQLSKIALLVFMLSFAIMTPLGTFISGSFPILNEYYSQISAVVIGILFHISSTIIFESSEGHKFNIAKISMIILGIGLACFI